MWLRCQGQADSTQARQGQADYLEARPSGPHTRAGVEPLMRGRGPRRRQRPPPNPADIERKRIRGIYSRWGGVSPPRPAEVMKVIAKSNVSRLQSAQRQKQKESTAASFKRRKSQRREYWRRRSGQAPEVGMGGSSAPITKQQPRLIPAQERRANGWASRGPKSSLTPELALEIAGLLESGASIEGIAKRTGHPASTVRHWVRSGRVAALGRSQQNTANT